jgi:hypothetical protein
LKLSHDSKEEVYEINCLVNMSFIHERKSNFDLATQLLEKALKIDPDNVKIKEKLNYLKSIIGWVKGNKNKKEDIKVVD